MYLFFGHILFSFVTFHSSLHRQPDGLASVLGLHDFPFQLVEPLARVKHLADLTVLANEDAAFHHIGVSAHSKGKGKRKAGSSSLPAIFAPSFIPYILFGFFLLQAVDLVGISILYHCQEHVVLIVVIVVFDKNVAHIASRYLA